MVEARHADERIAIFRELHTAGCFVIPNPWDRGSALLLASMGFKALASSSAALAFVHGRVDAPTSLDREETIRNIRTLVEATPLPVSADFQSGFGDDAEAVADSVALAVDTGAAGLSIEDATGDDDAPLFPRAEALDRVRAARAAIDASGRRVVLTARAEAFLVGHHDPLPEVIERLTAFADAGADCLYAPGLRTPAEIRAVVAAVAPKPVNVLVADPSWMTVEALGELGVRRISVGSALCRVAWGGVLEAAREIADGGSFRSLQRAASFDTLNRLYEDTGAS